MTRGTMSGIEDPDPRPERVSDIEALLSVRRPVRTGAARSPLYELLFPGVGLALAIGGFFRLLMLIPQVAASGAGSSPGRRAQCRVAADRAEDCSSGGATRPAGKRALLR